MAAAGHYALLARAPAGAPRPQSRAPPGTLAARLGRGWEPARRGERTGRRAPEGGWDPRARLSRPPTPRRVPSLLTSGARWPLASSRSLFSPPASAGPLTPSTRSPGHPAGTACPPSKGRRACAPCAGRGRRRASRWRGGDAGRRAAGCSGSGCVRVAGSAFPSPPNRRCPPPGLTSNLRSAPPPSLRGPGHRLASTVAGGRAPSARGRLPAFPENSGGHCGWSAVPCEPTTPARPSALRGP